MKNPSVDAYISRLELWQKEVTKLRAIILGCGLTEELKWGHPCYTFEGKNIVLIHEFKEYCALLFFKGALLEDREGILIRQTENVQAARQIRFTSVAEINEAASIVRAYVEEAIEVEKAGLSVELKKTAQFVMPEEFRSALAENHDLKSAFLKLSPGRQRGYLLWFAAPKQSKTRQSRIAKSTPHILAGKGLKD